MDNITLNGRSLKMNKSTSKKYLREFVVVNSPSNNGGLYGPLQFPSQSNDEQSAAIFVLQLYEAPMAEPVGHIKH